MVKVGEISEIWRYPVKGMAGEALATARLGAQGLAGDRIWAVRDVARGEIQSCKFRPELLLCSASATAPEGAAAQVEIRFPDGAVLGGHDTAAHARVSALVGHASTLEPLRPLSELDFYRRHKRDDHTWLDELKATFAREDHEPLPGFFDAMPEAAKEFVTLPGSFFLVTPFHVLTTATLAWLRGLQPASDWDARRFRPNVLIDTGHGQAGLLEQDWIGRQLVIGDALVDCPGTTPRCGAITRAQRELPADKSILRSVVRHADQNVGVYGTVASGGELRLGDAVYLQ
ncbi:MOSC domain-containing protein [Pseudorhodoferax sp.]|uniref:MOSC domain-containing protein n=1 Tax=Pseudorhodoferax sp. TaxID=1993553 RepID=UPI002DD64BB0|nr:MOSC N-terminal beta barrel domain-containing protein [Pseudorhodoferax sp.]